MRVRLLRYGILLICVYACVHGALAFLRKIPEPPFRYEQGEPPAALAFSADGNELVSASQHLITFDVIIHRWNLTSGKRTDVLIDTPVKGWWGGIPDVPGPYTWLVLLSADGRLAAFGSGTGKALFVCDTTSGKVLQRFATNSYDFALSPDGKLIAYAHDKSRDSLVVADVESGKPLGIVPGTDAVFRADHRTCVVHDPKGGLAIWSLEKPFKQLRRLGAPAPWECGVCALTPDGTTVVSVCRHSTGPTLGETLLIWWDVVTGRLIRQSTIDVAVDYLDFSPDCQLLAFMGGQALHVWNTDTNTELMTRPAKDLQTNLCLRENGWPREGRFRGMIAFSPDKKTLAIPGVDNRIRLWNISTGVELTRR